MSEQDRLDRAQEALNVASVAAGVGMLSTLFCMTLNVPIAVGGPWLAFCATVAVVAVAVSIARLFGHGEWGRN